MFVNDRQTLDAECVADKKIECRAHVADSDYQPGTKIRFLGCLTAGAQDLATQGHDQYDCKILEDISWCSLNTSKPPSHQALYEWVFWLHDRQAFRPQPKHSKMNQCPVELQKEQFHTRRFVSDLMLFHEV